jgi:class 3 adenylate cyclase
VMGAGTLNKFGVTGDPINVASRVEGLTRVHQVDLLVTEEIRRKLDSHFVLRPMPATAVKGKLEPIVTYFVEGVA